MDALYHTNRMVKLGMILMLYSQHKTGFKSWCGRMDNVSSQLCASSNSAIRMRHLILHMIVLILISLLKMLKIDATKFRFEKSVKCKQKKYAAYLDVHPNEKFYDYDIV